MLRAISCSTDAGSQADGLPLRMTGPGDGVLEPPGVHRHAARPQCVPGAIAEAGLTASKTGVTFPPHKPLPDHVVTQLASASSRHVDD
ncbi:hypothetical protein GCM10010264_37340 [Streptomyces globisporus]|nr:hypothetical protein GCM10010264_37340 [Streptomyces globisporus]